MARMTMLKGDAFVNQLKKLQGKELDKACKSAVYTGAGIVVKEVRDRLLSLPTDTFRYLRDGDIFTGVPEEQQQDLADSLGVAPIDVDDTGNWNTKVGFDGYGTKPTKKYPKGLPNQMIARAIESGSSVRAKTPFVRPAITRSRKKANAAMGAVVDKFIEKTNGGK